MSERVVITGLGVVSSLGCELEEFWSNLTQGKSGVSEVTSFDTLDLERHYGGEVKNFRLPKPLDSEEINLFPRTHQFALSASLSALRDSTLESRKDLGVAVGSIVGGLEVLEGKKDNFKNYPVYTLTSAICNVFGLEGLAFTLSGACAAGNYALSLAYQRIKEGREKIILAGAADFFSQSTFVGFHRLFSLAPFKCQPFDKNRRGLIPAEGAGMLVVESLSSAKERKAKIYAEVLGCGFSCDAYHPVIPSDEGIFYCLKDTLDATGLSPGDIDYINAHGTGTISNDKAECKAVKKLWGKKHYKRIPISSIKSMLGHTMGAASSLEAISCCLTIERGVIPPTINFETPDPECDIDCVPNQARKQKVKTVLNNSFGFGGMNCSLVLAAYSP